MPTMATKEIRSETWREMFFYTEADLAYFDEPRDSYYQFDPPNHLDDSHDNVEMMHGADGTAEPEDEEEIIPSIECDEMDFAPSSPCAASMETADDDTQTSKSDATITNSRVRSVTECITKTELIPHGKQLERSGYLGVSLDHLPVFDAVRLHRPQEGQRMYTTETDSALFKGIKEHLGDLRLADVVVKEDGGKAIMARSKVNVVGEYTFIEETPSQERKNSMFPAVYVPGNAYSWKTIQPQSNLNEGHNPAVMGDEHHARQPNFPYEPTLRALLHKQQDHDGDVKSSVINMRTIEIFTDAEVLTQLFKFIADSSKTPAFRLELSLVRNTLFIEQYHHHGKGRINKGGRVKQSIPVWAPDALRRVGFEEPRLPFSGGHFRVVRYRLGTNLVCAVRSKVDFVYEGRKMPSKSTFDPLEGVVPEYNTTADDEEEEENSIKTWRTTVKNLGIGTKPDNTGKASLRFAWESDRDYDERVTSSKLPLLWFSRTAYLVDAVVSKNLTVIESRLRCVKDVKYYRTWENEHQASLQKLSALLGKLKRLTQDLGGSCVLVCKPCSEGLMVLKPYVEKGSPVPEEIAAQLWGPAEEGFMTTEYESTAASQSSGLSSVRSKTPSGFTDWKLDSPGEKHRKQKRAVSCARVHNWLDRPQRDEPGEVFEHHIEEESSDEDLAPDDSFSVRSRSFTSPARRSQMLPEQGYRGTRCGGDGAMDVDEDAEGEEQDEQEEEEDADEESSVKHLRLHRSRSFSRVFLRNQMLNAEGFVRTGSVNYIRVNGSMDVDDDVDEDEEEDIDEEPSDEDLRPRRSQSFNRPILRNQMLNAEGYNRGHDYPRADGGEMDEEEEEDDYAEYEDEQYVRYAGNDGYEGEYDDDGGDEKYTDDFDHNPHWYDERGKRYGPHEKLRSNVVYDKYGNPIDGFDLNDDEEGRVEEEEGDSETLAEHGDGGAYATRQVATAEASEEEDEFEDDDEEVIDEAEG